MAEKNNFSVTALRQKNTNWTIGVNATSFRDSVDVALNNRISNGFRDGGEFEIITTNNLGMTMHYIVNMDVVNDYTIRYKVTIKAKEDDNNGLTKAKTKRVTRKAKKSV